MHDDEATGTHRPCLLPLLSYTLPLLPLLSLLSLLSPCPSCPSHACCASDTPQEKVAMLSGIRLWCKRRIAKV